jgi:hypothetical protein
VAKGHIEREGEAERRGDAIPDRVLDVSTPKYAWMMFGCIAVAPNAYGSNKVKVEVEVERNAGQGQRQEQEQEHQLRQVALFGVC